MSKCKNCKNLYNLSNNDDVIVGKWCPKVNDSPHEEIERDCEDYKSNTNADRIRSMTDEELALAIMCPAEYDSNFNKRETCNGEMNKNCYGCSLKWLRAESEE